MRRDYLWITLCVIGVVRPVRAEAQDQYLHGRVVEAASGEPLTGAVVVVVIDLRAPSQTRMAGLA